MKRFLVATAALSVLIPALAAAQDRGPDQGGRGGWSGRGGDGGYQGRGGGGQPSAAGAQDNGGRGDGDRGGDGRGYRGRGPSSQPQAPAQPQAQPQPAPQAAPAQGGFRDGRAGGSGNFVTRGYRTDGYVGRNPGQTGRAQGDRGPDNRFDNRGAGNPGQADRSFNGRAPNDRSFDNRGYDNRGYGDRSYDNRGFSGRSFDGRGYDNRGDSARRDGGRFSYRGNSYARLRMSPYSWPRGYYSNGYRWSARQILPSVFLQRQYYINDYYDLGFGPPPYGTEWIRVGDDALLVDTYTGEIVEVVPNVFYW